MKPDFMERLALINGRFGRWFMVLYSAIFGFIGGVTGGAILSGVVSGALNVEFESDQVTIWVVFSSGFCGALLTGLWCRRRLNLLIKNSTEQGADGDAEEAV